MPVQLDDAAASGADFRIIGQQDGLRLLAGNKVERTRVITAQSVLYALQFTFAITYAAWQAGETRALVAEKTAQVNALAGYEHAVEVSTAQDVDGNGNIINQLVVTVGTDDGSQTVDVHLRMDSLGLPSAPAALARAYATLAHAGGF